MKRLLLLIVLLFSLLYLNTNTYSGFVDQPEIKCPEYKDCARCASASGCGWCPKSNICIYTKNLLSTDECNQMNTITSVFSCSNKESKQFMGPTRPIKEFDLSLYQNQIGNKFPPPNVYMGERIDYSNEDVYSNGNQIRNDMKNLRDELPGIISLAVESSIKPMIKGAVSDMNRSGY
jgi:hypothetical protein